MTDFGISHIWNFWYGTLSKIGGGCNHLLLIYNPLMLSSDVFVIKSQVLCLQRAYFKNKIQGSVVPRSIMTNMNYFEYQYCQTLNMLSSIMKSMKYVNVLSMSYSIRRNFHRTSKFSSNLIVYLLFLFFAVPKKRRNCCGIFFF